MMWKPDQGRVLIAGASGQVGTAVCAYLQSRGKGSLALQAGRVPMPGWLTLDFDRLREQADVDASVQEDQTNFAIPNLNRETERVALSSVVLSGQRVICATPFTTRKRARTRRKTQRPIR